MVSIPRKLTDPDELPPPPEPPPLPHWAAADVRLMREYIAMRAQHTDMLKRYVQLRKDRYQILEVINQRLDREGMFFLCNLLKRLERAEAKARGPHGRRMEAV